MGTTGAYGNWEARQQRAATIVYDADGIKRLVTKCALAGTPCNIVLGDNIIATAGFTFPAGLPSLTIDGGGEYKFVADGAIGTLFACNCPAFFSRVSVKIKTGATITTLFQAPNATADVSQILVVEDISVHPASTHSGIGAGLTNVFGANPSAAIFAHRLNIFSGTNLFRENATTPESYNGGRFVDFAGLAPLTIGTVGGTTAFSGAVFDGFAAIGGITINGGSGGNVFSRIPITTIANNVAAGGNIFLGIPWSASAGPTLSDLDIWVTRWGNSNAPRAVTLNTAGPTITPAAPEEYIRVTHGGSASGNVTIAAGRNGQRLTLYFVSVAGTAAYTDGSGNLEFASNFTPTAADTLSLIYDATTSKWVELCRSVN